VFGRPLDLRSGLSSDLLGQRLFSPVLGRPLDLRAGLSSDLLGQRLFSPVLGRLFDFGLSFPPLLFVNFFIFFMPYKVESQTCCYNLGGKCSLIINIFYV
jgi:hypothetical protein